MEEALQRTVFTRDGQACVAPWLGAVTPCATADHRFPMAGRRSDFEIDHVRGVRAIGSLQVGRQGGGYGQRPPNDVEHLVTLCHHHHQGGWATSNRYVLRLYLLYHALCAALADAAHDLWDDWEASGGPRSSRQRVQALLEERP